MRITKNEKSLWTFLNIFKQIISRTTGQVIIFGDEEKLTINTNNYVGIFEKEKQGMFAEYDFGPNYYDLLQLPSGDYVLNKIKPGEEPEDDERNRIERIINDSLDLKEWVLELEKSDPHKIAKITAYTNLWINDNDIKYINAFNQVNVHKDELHNALIFESYGLTDEDIASVNMILIMKKLETNKPVQQKVIFDVKGEIETVDELIEETESELEDEFEDEFDPMLA